MRKLSLLLLMSVIAGCSRAEPALPMSHSAFIAVMVELRRASLEGGDFASRRATILRDAGVSEAQLSAYVQRMAHRPGEMAAVFDSISLRLATVDAVQ